MKSLKKWFKVGRVAKSLEKLQKVMKSHETLRKVVKSREKTRKIAKSREKFRKVDKSYEESKKIAKGFGKNKSTSLRINGAVGLGSTIRARTFLKLEAYDAWCTETTSFVQAAQRT